MSYQFYTTCEDSYAVGEYGEDITEMVESAHRVDIDSDDFINKIAEKYNFKSHVLEIMNFENEDEFSSDWNIDCNKSYFQGHECFYVKFSGIEHIFLNQSSFSKVLNGEDAENRRKVIEEIEEVLDSDSDWINAKDTKKQFKALKKFTEENLDKFKQNNILLSSIFSYHNNFKSIIKKIDEELIINPSKDKSFDLS